MQVIRYVGRAHRRHITATDWQRAGFKNGESIEWSWKNGFEQLSNALTSDQIAKVIAPDLGFALIDVKELRGPLECRMTPAQAAKRPVNPNVAMNVSTATSAASNDAPVTDTVTPAP